MSVQATTPPSRSTTPSLATSIVMGVRRGNTSNAVSSTGPAAFIAPPPSTTMIRRDGGCAVTACSVWVMIASGEATSRPARSGAQAAAAVDRATVTAANGAGVAGSGTLPRTSSPSATRARERRRGLGARVLAREPQGVLDARGDVEVSLREVGQAQRAGAEPRQLQRGGDADACLHDAAVGLHRKALHENPVRGAGRHEDRIAAGADDALIRAPGK